MSLWNDLSEELKSSSSVTTLKSRIRKETNEINILYYYGERWSSIHHARMRIGCSKLRKDLYYNLHVVEDSMCTCGVLVEDAKHFFLQCPNYNHIRATLIHDLQNLMPITIRNILFGNKKFTLAINKKVFDAVHKFIKDSKRFD